MRLEGTSIDANYVLVDACSSMETSGDIVDLIYGLVAVVISLLLWALFILCLRVDPMRKCGCLRDCLALPEENGVKAICACLRCGGTNTALDDRVEEDEKRNHPLDRE
eukprot:5870681-Amphidinium_carterae.1